MKEWHAIARRMHDSGMTIAQIARDLGKDRSDIKWACDINGARERKRSRNQARRARSGPEKAYPRRPKPVPPKPVRKRAVALLEQIKESHFVQKHKRREIGGRKDWDASVRLVTIAYARGAISREEMMEKLAP